VLPVSRLHRHVGMGGDQFVQAVAGKRVEDEHGDAVRERWEKLFDETIDEIAPLAGARKLMVELKARGHPVVFASSAIGKHVEHFLDLLDAREVVDAWTTKEDVDSSKPEPDLIQAALSKVVASDGVVVGDTPWDVHAARRAGLETICVLTGGFAEAELRAAGAMEVYESVAELRADLDRTPLA